ncbi:valyl-tRNA ligase [Advenella kashmirensis WT001]|uniref:valine--tRNA ligase n=1 Tax=Advenella kashmirensis (strain DSM 17095 / LMG 22695 / WT001) TaxID=1036672 RepID=I3UCR9_ADVKW|nr:valyl-tRNA ligase [Advenella kashmirensis WT001]
MTQTPAPDELPKSFEPKALERAWYQEWERMGVFRAGRHTSTDAPESGEPYTIQFPPPNVTGTLHMGHAFNHTIMDGLIRYHRMLGSDTVLVPGTDHAGIATQIVVERQLDAQKTTRHDLGRDAFVKRVWEWKEQSGNTITAQVRRLGARQTGRVNISPWTAKCRWAWSKPLSACTSRASSTAANDW